MRQNLKKYNVVTGETPFFVTAHFILLILFVLTLASDRELLYENVAFGILVLSTKKRYSSFSKKVFVFPWKYNNTRHAISLSVSKISFSFLMTPIGSTNYQNTCLDLFKTTFTH